MNLASTLWALAGRLVSPRLQIVSFKTRLVTKTQITAFKKKDSLTRDHSKIKVFKTQGE